MSFDPVSHRKFHPEQPVCHPQFAQRRSSFSAWLLCFSLAVLALLVGCGGSTHPLVGKITFPNGAVSAVAPGGVVALSAGVVNDSKGLGVDWAVTCTPPATTVTVPAPTCGFFSPTHTPSESFTSFTAPNAIPADGYVILTATATTDPTRTSSLTLKVSGDPLSVAITPSVANVEVNGQAQFTANVLNDPANAGVNWTLTCGTQTGLECGQLLQIQSASGSPITYVGPVSIPNGQVILTATSITNPTVSAQTVITIVPAITVNFFTAPPAILAPSASTNLIAVVANDFGSGGVTWTASDGTFSVLQTASGAATVYTAPGTTGSSVTITATSVTDPTKSATATIAIAYNIAVGISSAVTTMHAGGTASFAATVSNDGTNGGVRWSATAGTFSPTQTASGVTTTYTAPPAIPAGGTVTITATSATDPTKFTTATVTITAPAVAIAIAPPSATLQLGSLVGFVAVVTNDPTNSGVTWTATAGTFNPTQTASGAATLYTAPSAEPAGGTVTVTATSVADPTKSATAIVTLSSTAPAISVSVSPTALTLAPGANGNLTASVSNDSSSGGVNWTTTAGTLSLTQTASGVPTTFTAPSTVPAGGTVTVTATSVTDPTKSATATITVATASANSLLTGQYAFSMSGQNSQGGGLDVASESYLGSFSADGNGNITAGEVDFNFSQLVNGTGVGNISGLTGTYSLDASGHGTITLQNVAQSYALTLSVAMVKPGHGLIMSTTNDINNGVLNGTLDQQTSGSFSTPLNGTFAFTFALPYTGGFEPDDLGGILTITNGTISNYLLDENNSGTPTTSTLSASDVFGPPDTNGRGTFVSNSFGSQTGLTLAYYIVDSTHFLIGTTQGGGGLGAAWLQPATLPTSLAGTYVFTESAFNAGGSITEQVNAGGVFTCDASGNLVSGTLDVNSGGAFTTGAIAGTCALDDPADGRGTITLTSGSSGGVSSFAVYPTASNGFLLLDMDTTVGGIGNAYTQSSSVTASNFAGSYASSFSTYANGGGGATTLLGPVTANGTAALAGTVDINDFGEPTPTLGATLAGNGVLTDTGNGRLTGEFTTSATTGGSSLVYDLQQIFYVVDANTVLTLESDTNPGIGTLQMQSLTTP